MVQIDVFAHIHAIFGETIQVTSHPIHDFVEKDVKSAKLHKEIVFSYEKCENLIVFMKISFLYEHLIFV